MFQIHDPDPGAPINIDDFSSDDFAGDMSMSFWPDESHGVPEPTTVALLFLGGSALVRVCRRRG
jgi:hypothetical protein